MVYRKSIYTLLVLVLSVLSVSSFAADRSERLKPKWLTHSLPQSKSGTYFFITTYGVGNSIEASRKAAFINLSDKLEREHGMVINIDFHQVSKNVTTTTGSTGSRESEIELHAIERGKSINIVCRAIDEWWEYKNGKYDCYILYAVSNGTFHAGSNADNIKVTAKYPAAGFLSLIPSAGQFHKGDKLKGGFILGAEIIAAGGILICEDTRANYIKKMHEQPRYAAEYNSLAAKWASGRNICIGAAAAIYAYNLIDAFAAEGAKKIVIKRNPVYFQAVPYADSRSVGMGLTFQF